MRRTTAQSRLVALADGMAAVVTDEGVQLDLDSFLESLKSIWKQGDTRPTAVPKPKQKRGRRRPDPLVAVTADLRSWFAQEPWRTGREVLDRLQAERPGEYSDALLRTLQRRLKVWRSERARELIFGIAEKSATATKGTDPRATADVW